VRRKFSHISVIRCLTPGKNQQAVGYKLDASEFFNIQEF